MHCMYYTTALRFGLKPALLRTIQHTRTRHNRHDSGQCVRQTAGLVFSASRKHSLDGWKHRAGAYACSKRAGSWPASACDGHTFSEDVPVLPQPALMTRGPAGTSDMAWNSSGNADVSPSAVLTLLSRLTWGAPAAFLDLLRVVMPPE